MKTINETMTVKGVADLCQTTERTIRRWITKLNDQHGQNVHVDGQNVHVAIDVAKGVETRLTYNQVLSIAEIGRGKPFASLLVENFNNQKALTTTTDKPNLNNDDMLKAIAVMSYKLEDIQRTQSRLLQIEDKSTSSNIEELKKYVKETIEDYSATIYDKIDSYNTEVLSKIPCPIKISDIWREPKKISKDEYSLLIRQTVNDYAVLNQTPVKTCYTMLYAKFKDLTKINIYVQKKLDGDNKQSYLDYILSKYPNAGKDLIGILAEMLDEAPF